MSAHIAAKHWFCPDCDGRGQVLHPRWGYDVDCTECMGCGYVSEQPSPDAKPYAVTTSRRWFGSRKRGTDPLVKMQQHRVGGYRAVYASERRFAMKRVRLPG